MAQAVAGGDPFFGVAFDRFGNEVDASVADLRHVEFEVSLLILGEYDPLIFQILHALGPHLLAGRASHRKHLIELINGILAGKRLVPQIQLYHDAPERKHIYIDRVGKVEDELRRPVPPRGHVVGVSGCLPALAQSEVHDLYVF